MSKESVKGTIDANIRQNGQGLITGVVLNAVLTDMLNDAYDHYFDLNVETGILTFMGVRFQLVKIIEESANTAICGNAICGLAICGNE